MASRSGSAESYTARPLCVSSSRRSCGACRRPGACMDTGSCGVGLTPPLLQAALTSDPEFSTRTRAPLAHLSRRPLHQPLLVHELPQRGARGLRHHRAALQTGACGRAGRRQALWRDGAPGLLTLSQAARQQEPGERKAHTPCSACLLVRRKGGADEAFHVGAARHAAVGHALQQQLLQVAGGLLRHLLLGGCGAVWEAVRKKRVSERSACRAGMWAGAATCDPLPSVQPWASKHQAGNCSPAGEGCRVPHRRGRPPLAPARG